MAEQKTCLSNAAQIEFWNSAAARAWADQHERMDRAVAEVTKALLDLAAPQLGERVLDIGCGSGTTVLELAARVGPDGHVLGADVAEQSVARARERITDAGLRHAEAIVTDVSSQPFEPNSFDLSFSRFGVMFFGDPVTAFANVCRAMKPGGRVALGVFRAAADNLWPNSPVAAVRHLLPPIPVPGPGEPGPFSWADPGRVHRILEGAGFRDVSLTALDPLIQLGARAAEAANFMMLFGPLTRILPALPAPQHDAIRSALEVFFQGHTTSQGVVLPAANWVVKARIWSAGSWCWYGEEITKTTRGRFGSHRHPCQERWDRLEGASGLTAGQTPRPWRRCATQLRSNCLSIRSPYALTPRINSAQRSSTGKVFSAGSGGYVVTTRATPISR